MEKKLLLAEPDDMNGIVWLISIVEAEQLPRFSLVKWRRGITCFQLALHSQTERDLSVLRLSIEICRINVGDRDRLHTETICYRTSGGGATYRVQNTASWTLARTVARQVLITLIRVRQLELRTNATSHIIEDLAESHLKDGVDWSERPIVNCPVPPKAVSPQSYLVRRYPLEKQSVAER